MPTLSALILAGGHSRRMGTDKALLPLPLAPAHSLSVSSNPAPKDQPLLLHTVQIARQVATDVAVVTPWPSRYRTLLAATDVRLIQEPLPTHRPSFNPAPHNPAPHNPAPHNPAPQHSTHSRQRLSAGPLSGFACGLQHITSDWCLLLACDLPYLNAVELTQWWHWIVSTCGHDAVTNAGTTTGPSTSPFPEAPMASLAPSRKGWEPLCGFYHRSCLVSLTHQLATTQRAFQPWLRQLSVARYDLLSPQTFFNCNTPAEWQSVRGEQQLR